MTNNLDKTKTYLVGHMQYADGKDWREVVEKRLTPRGITCFNPYNKPHLEDFDESDSSRAERMELMERGDFNPVHEEMKRIRASDLNLCDRSDFIIAHIIPNVASWGSAEEIVTSVRMKKPIFIAIEGGVKKTPLWLMGMVPPKFLYDDIESIIQMIEAIDDGTVDIDSDRWRLLKKEYR